MKPSNRIRWKKWTKNRTTLDPMPNIQCLMSNVNVSTIRLLLNDASIGFSVFNWSWCANEWQLYYWDFWWNGRLTWYKKENSELMGHLFCVKYSKTPCSGLIICLHFMICSLLYKKLRVSSINFDIWLAW